MSNDKQTEKQKAADAKAAEAKKAADVKAAEAKKVADAKAAEAKKLADKAVADAAKAKADADKAAAKALADKEAAEKKAAAAKQKEADKAAKDAEKAAAKAAKDAEREAKKNQPRVPRTKPWEDMQPGAQQKPPRNPSVFNTTIELMLTNKGATIAEIEAAIGPKHPVLRLLRWANRELGYGFVMSPSTQKIMYLAPNLKVPTPTAPAAS